MIEYSPGMQLLFFFFFSPPHNNKALCLSRCQKEFELRDAAVQGDPDTQKKFHAFVLFLGELYLHLEVRNPCFTHSLAYSLIHPFFFALVLIRCADVCPLISKQAS